MIWPADYHMHTPLCRHATGEPVEYAAHAVKLGLKEIGFSDHSPMKRDDFDDWRMRADQLNEYIAKVQFAREQFPQLTIKLGLEVDYLPGQEAWIEHLQTLAPWDYLLGAVHYVSDSWDVDNPAKLSEWKMRDPMEVWTAYFERLTAAAESGLFDIIAHADLPKKFGIIPKEDLTPLYDKFIKGLRRYGMAMELNTAGLRKDCKEIYPAKKLVELAFAAHVPITFASDAHKPEEVGMNFTEAMELARGAGYSRSVIFKERRYEFVSF